MSSWTARTILSAVVATTSFLIFLLFFAAGEGGASSQGQRVRWYAGNDELNSKGQSLALGDGTHSFSLKTGWSCTVGATSKQLPAYEARTTICEKSAEAFQFVVQCERSRPRDHTQIGFLTPDRKLGDFIEVGCELF